MNPNPVDIILRRAAEPVPFYRTAVQLVQHDRKTPAMISAPNMARYLFTDYDYRLALLASS
ncbi:MAG: hypothetical protein D6800_06690 [Candidatus Zixiibacteriota bacterium]|nr:MAG: hypothetical protein D6800_06690 [candidate division Zixibacteria bacterium]